MRELKFRAWDKKEKKMLSIAGIKETILTFVRDAWRINEDDDFGSCICWNDDGILMQYTGLKDKQGKEIYEGDIVKGIWGKNNVNIFKVIYTNSGFEGEKADGEPEVFDDFDGNLEVIGNIYENKNLIKE